MGEEMLPAQETPSSTQCHKLEPQAKMPTPAVLRSLTPDDIKVLRNLLSERTEYIANDFFDCPDAEEHLTGPLPQLDCGPVADESESDDSGVYRLTEARPRMSKDERERFLFLRLNYCRRRVLEILQRHVGTRLNADSVGKVLYWEGLALETRSEIVRENVPLVLAMAKRTRIVGIDLTDLISEGNLALLRAVVKFDCARGFKFSTYACRAILKSFSRVATRAARYRGHFPTEFDPELEKGDYAAQRRVAREDDCIDELKTIMDDNTAKLSDVERTVISARFSLDQQDDDAAERARTLEQVGEMIGVTKERVRQIQNKALAKLRSALEESVLAQ
jgi:RNA polymerase sigma factor (sigma-70 family)